MAWDLALDSLTGDLVFGPTLDLLGVSGPELDVQRIIVRTKIPRGSFVYDEDKTLGSNLHLVSRNPNRVEEARSYIMEALAEADGISVDEVLISLDDFGQMVADVKFTSTVSLDDDDSTEGFESESDQAEFDARIPLGHLE